MSLLQTTPGVPQFAAYFSSTGGSSCLEFLFPSSGKLSNMILFVYSLDNFLPRLENREFCLTLNLNLISVSCVSVSLHFSVFSVEVEIRPDEANEIT